MKHTPGPWKVHNKDCVTIMNTDRARPKADECIVQTCGPNAEADARLIAAAPTMLQALLDIRLSIIMGAGGGVTDTAWIVNSTSETIVERIDGILISLGYDPEKLGDE